MTESFEKGRATPALGSTPFLCDSPLSEWIASRDSGIAPLHSSELAGSDADRLEFLGGAELLRLYGPRAKAGVSLQPQQLRVHDMLAAGRVSNSILVPRRSSKTTSLIAEGLGRAEHRDDYRVAVLTATTGKAGRSRFTKDVTPPLEFLYPDKRTAPFAITRAAGQEAVRFHQSQGFVQWLSSIEDARGEAFDLVIVDEAQDPEPERAVDILAAVLPTIDTRPGAQIVFAGTVGRYRTGNLLWDALERGRAGRGGILEYASPDSTTEAELAAWEPDDEHPEARVRELIELTHPGVGGLTTIDAVHDRFDSLKAETFAAEYMGIWPVSDGAGRLFDTARWEAAAIHGPLPKPPERFALVMGVHPEQISACLVAVWRDDEGRAHLLLLDHRRGVQWVAREAAAIARKYKVGVVHDTLGAVTVEVEQLQRMNPRPRLEPQTFGNVKTAAALLVKEFEAGRVVHYDQPAMNEAARLVRKRPVGPTAWALGRRDPNDDVVPIEAAALGLRYFDAKPQRVLPSVI